MDHHIRSTFRRSSNCLFYCVFLYNRLRSYDLRSALGAVRTFLPDFHVRFGNLCEFLGLEAVFLSRSDAGNPKSGGAEEDSINEETLN